MNQDFSSTISLIASVATLILFIFYFVLGLLRIAYSDVFGNQYYQDVPFSYDESVFQKEHMMEISGIKAPMLAKDAPALLELIKEEYPEHYR